MAERDAMLIPMKPLVFPHVFIGRDSRTSSPELVDAVMKGLECMKVPYTDFEEVTTAQLHFLVANYRNPEPIPEKEEEKKVVSFEEKKHVEQVVVKPLDNSDSQPSQLSLKSPHLKGSGDGRDSKLSASAKSNLIIAREGSAMSRTSNVSKQTSKSKASSS